MNKKYIGLCMIILIASAMIVHRVMETFQNDTKYIQCIKNYSATNPLTAVSEVNIFCENIE